MSDPLISSISVHGNCFASFGSVPFSFSTSSDTPSPSSSVSVTSGVPSPSVSLCTVILNVSIEAVLSELLALTSTSITLSSSSLPQSLIFGAPEIVFVLGS